MSFNKRYIKRENLDYAATQGLDYLINYITKPDALIIESDGISKRPHQLLPKIPTNNADFMSGLGHFNGLCEQTNPGVCDHTKLILAWHGTSAVEAVCRDGPRSFRTTDPGFFGGESYLALECSYAARYSEFSPPNSQGEFAVILFACCVAPHPYVITLMDDYGGPRCDVDGFSQFFGVDATHAKSLMPKYNAHFVPVKRYGPYPHNTHPVTGQLLYLLDANGQPAIDPSTHQPIPLALDYQACSNAAAEGHELVLNHKYTLPIAVLWYRH